MSANETIKPRTEDLHVIVVYGGQRYATALLGISVRRKRVQTKFGAIKFADVIGYRLPHTATIQPNAHMLLSLSRLP